MNHIRAEGIVIRSYDYGEGHRIVLIYTKDMGKIRASARGSRKIRSKFASFLEPLTGNRFMLYRRGDNPVYTLTGVEVFNPYSALREDMRRFGYGSLMLEIVDILCCDEDPDIELYFLLLEALTDLETGPSASTAWLFLFRALKLAGYRLNMFRCCECGVKPPGGAVFSPPAGGIICSSCSPQEPFWSVSEETLADIKNLGPGAELKSGSEKAIGNIITKYIKYQLDREIRSTGFLEIFKDNVLSGTDRDTKQLLGR